MNRKEVWSTAVKKGRLRTNYGSLVILSLLTTVEEFIAIGLATLDGSSLRAPSRGDVPVSMRRI